MEGVDAGFIAVLSLFVPCTTASVRLHRCSHHGCIVSFHDRIWTNCQSRSIRRLLPYRIDIDSYQAKLIGGCIVHFHGSKLWRLLFCTIGKFLVNMYLFTSYDSVQEFADAAIGDCDNFEQLS